MIASLVRRLAPILRDFWTVPIRAEPLAAFRICVVLTTLGSLLTGLAWQLDFVAGPEGTCPAKVLDPWLKETHRHCLLRGPVNFPGSELLVGEEASAAWREWGARPESVSLLFGVFLVALVCLGLGFLTRLSALVCVVLAATFYARFVWLMNGGDSLLRNCLYFLLLSPAGATWSVDAWLRRRFGGSLALPGSAPPAGKPVFIPPWSVRLMQIQLGVIYFFTGIAKMSGWDYFTGEAVYWVLNDVAVTRWSYAQVPVPMLVCRLLSWATLLFEAGFPIFLLIPRLRPWLLLAGLGFHLGLLAVLEIGWFGQATLCFYVLFVSGERLARIRGK